MHKEIPFSEYIQIHRRLRATRSDYYVNNWRLLLPPFIAFFALAFTLQSLALAGVGSSFVFRSLVFLLFALVTLFDGPRCLKRRRQIIYDEWRQGRTS